MSKEIKQESLDRKIRRHEVSFSKIKGKSKNFDMDSYLANKGHASPSPEDVYLEEINTKVLYRNIYKLPKDDREILLDYMLKVPQKATAKKYNVSESAISQRLDKIIYNYRVFLCNDKDFAETKEYDKLQIETEYGFKKYLREIRESRKFKIDLNQVQDFIKEVKKAIRHTIQTGANENIKQKLSKQIDYSNLDDKYIENLNKAFAEYGIEAHFENLKTFQGNVMQVLKIVDDFINELENKAYQNPQTERWHFSEDKLLDLVLSDKKTATCYLYKAEGKLANVGDLSIITTANGEDKSLVKTEMIKILPFKEMSWNLAKLEGETSTLADWRKIHEKFFKEIDQNFNENTQIVFEKFKVLKKF